ncbi:MAG: transmembrane 220 family protein [Myxococcota bacterium]
MPIILSGLHLLMAALFVLSAAVQYNDPDPSLWITIYTGAALLSLQAASRRLVFPVAWAWCLGAIAVAIWLVFTQIGALSMDLDNEVFRELGGLAITAFWMGVVAMQDSAQRRHQAALEAAERTGRTIASRPPK